MQVLALVTVCTSFQTLANTPVYHVPRHAVGMQVLTLVAGSAAFIRSAHGWRTVCALITVTCLHPDAAPTALNALSAVARSPALSDVAFMPVLEAIVTCVERCAKVWPCTWQHAFPVMFCHHFMSVREHERPGSHRCRLCRALRQGVWLRNWQHDIALQLLCLWVSTAVMLCVWSRSPCPGLLFVGLPCQHSRCRMWQSEYWYLQGCSC